MNLIHEMKKGLEGRAIGRSTGSKFLDTATLGIRAGASWLIAAAEKTGKSKWSRYHLVVQPYLQYLKSKHEFPTEWIIFSMEETRIRYEADVCAALIHEESGVIIPKARILGYDLTEDGDPILLSAEEQALVIECYNKHILPLFGEYDAETGKQITPGLITFYEYKITPNDLEYTLKEYAKNKGTIRYIKERRETENGPINVTRVNSFVPHNPNLQVIVIIDDYRLLKKQGNNKQTVDAAFEVVVDISQQFKWFFIAGIMHLNRENTDQKRIERIGKNRYYPTADLIKDTGNGGERMHAVLTLFNPKSPAFGMKRHFNHTLPDDDSYRSVHLVTSRDTIFPVSARFNFNGATCRCVDYEKIE